MAKKNKQKKVKTKLQQKRSQLVREKVIMQILFWVLLLTPICVFVRINYSVFFTWKDGLSVGIGIVIVAICVICVVKQETKIFNGIGKWIIAFLLSVLFASISAYFVAITGCILGGYFVSMWFKKPIERRKRLIKACDDMEIQQIGLSETTITTKQLEEVAKETEENALVENSTTNSQ